MIAEKFDCLLKVWTLYESELRLWLAKQHISAADSEDVVQDLFIKCLRQGEKFCLLDNPRAWLYAVVKRMLVDQYRLKKNWIELDENLPDEAVSDALPVDKLAMCLPHVLKELTENERQAIELCDIQGMSQRMFAQRFGISVSAAKSRLQRARHKLAEQLKKSCQVKFDADGKVCCFTPRYKN